METLIFKNYVGQEKKKKIAVVEGDIRDEIRKMPSMTFSGESFYFSAEMVESHHKYTKWYHDMKTRGPIPADFRCWSSDDDCNEWGIVEG